MSVVLDNLDRVPEGGGGGGGGGGGSRGALIPVLAGVAGAITANTRQV